MNTGFLQTDGIDVAASWILPISSLGLGEHGRLLFGLNGTWVNRSRVSPIPGQPSYDCAGLYGPTCGAPVPTWRHNLRVSWDNGAGVLLSVNWRLIGRASLDINDSATFSGVTGGRYESIDAKIPTYNYLDLSGAVDVTKAVSLRFGIRNIFDKNPPVVDNINLGINAQFGNGNTFPSLYDTQGRTLFAGFSARF